MLGELFEREPSRFPEQIPIGCHVGEALLALLAPPGLALGI
jgi:hypothetical protein